MEDLPNQIVLVDDSELKETIRNPWIKPGEDEECNMHGYYNGQEYFYSRSWRDWRPVKKKVEEKVEEKVEHLLSMTASNRAYIVALTKRAHEIDIQIELVGTKLKLVKAKSVAGQMYLCLSPFGGDMLISLPTNRRYVYRLLTNLGLTVDSSPVSMRMKELN